MWKLRWLEARGPWDFAINGETISLTTATSPSKQWWCSGQLCLVVLCRRTATKEGVRLKREKWAAKVARWGGCLTMTFFGGTAGYVEFHLNSTYYKYRKTCNSIVRYFLGSKTPKDVEIDMFFFKAKINTVLHFWVEPQPRYCNKECVPFKMGAMLLIYNRLV